LFKMLPKSPPLLFCWGFSCVSLLSIGMDGVAGDGVLSSKPGCAPDPAGNSPNCFLVGEDGWEFWPAGLWNIQKWTDVRLRMKDRIKINIFPRIAQLSEVTLLQFFLISYRGLAVTSHDDVIDRRPPYWRYFFVPRGTF
jgi:hypothetical protein